LFLGGFFVGVKMRLFVFVIMIYMAPGVVHADCEGRILHAGDGKICMLESGNITRPALCVGLNDKKYCVSLFAGNRGRLHVDLNGMSYSVPDFMTPIESVSFDGSSYINLGFVATTDLNFEIRADLDESILNRDGALLGGRDENPDQYVIWYNTLYGRPLVAPRLFERKPNNVIYDIPDGAITMRWENNVFTINGQEQQIEYFTTPINQGYVSLALGGLMTGPNTVDTRRFLGAIYYAKFWDGNGVIMDLVAATDAAGVAGMYDKVSGRMMYLTH